MQTKIRNLANLAADATNIWLLLYEIALNQCDYIGMDECNTGSDRAYNSIASMIDQTVKLEGSS